MQVQTRTDILDRRARVHHEAGTAQTGTPDTCQGSSTAWNCQNNGAVKITDARDPIGGARTCVLTLPPQAFSPTTNWFWGRPSVIDLWHDLRVVTSQIRPDWDLSKPGLREAWNAGDFSPFHGWNKKASVEDASVVRKK